MDENNSPKRFSSLQSWGWIFFLIILACTIYSYFKYIRLVPFHPDESTNLYMSSDFDLLWSDPRDMFWDINHENDAQQHYRKLDPPLTRYLLGAGRTIAGLPTLTADWDWGKSWEQNEGDGAFPSKKLLAAGRWSVALLLPFSIILLYLIGKHIDGDLTGALAVLFLITNSLLMLHTRRAMAEGILVFAVCFAIWSFMLGYKYPWLAGIGMALAFNAKQSTAALFPAGLIAVLIPTNTNEKSFPKWLDAAIQYVSLFIIITFILNPLWWQNPISAIKSSINARQELLARQVADTERLAPEKVLHSSSQRVAALFYNLYLAEPMFAEVGNYQAQTKAMEETYLIIPIQNLFRHPISAGILLTLSLFGFSIGLLRIIKHRNKQSRHLLLLFLATISQGAAIIWFIPLPWQRYLMPLIPFACLWMAFGAAQIIHLFCSNNRDYQK